MAKKIKQPEVTVIQKKKPEPKGYVTITGTGKGGLIENQDYKYPESAANHLVSVGHATLKQ
jgi:hypothetical protein